MTANQILNWHTINPTNDDYVAELIASIETQGWVGAPILVLSDQLLTGSHRLAALRAIESKYADGEYDGEQEDLIYNLLYCNEEVVSDVTEIVFENYFAEDEDRTHDDFWVDLQYDSIGHLLEGSWVEEYSSEIAEW